jgi:FAD synthetase
MSLKTAAIIIISKEILQDKKCDTVSKSLIKELNSLQYTIEKVTVIPEKEHVIVTELDSVVKNCDIVITLSEKCGTIYQAIGRMTSQALQQNEELVEVFKELKEPYETEDVYLPVQAKLISTSHVYPIIHFQRIFILKEKFLKYSFNKNFKNHLAQYRKDRIFWKNIKIAQNGNSIGELHEIKKISNNHVKMEYVRTDQFVTVKVTSGELSHVVQFEQKVRDKFGNHCLNSTYDSDVWDKVYLSCERHVKKAIENIESCIERYGLENIFVSFNGGKDCTVLLHLVLAVIKKKYAQYTQPIFCLYVQSESPFPEQDEFIQHSKTYYNLEIMTIKSGIKDALQETLKKNPNYKACFMGTRRTDPYSSYLQVFQMTDANWPQIMRVSPLLDWHYCDIWDYLLYYKVPYCTLYDMGFTSLGNTENTTRNPSLIYRDQFEEKEMYLPAYKMWKENTERNGRNSNGC